MTNQIGIYDHTTGENIVRDMTPEEVAEREAQVALNAARKAQEEQEAAEARAIKVSAYQKLGLSEAEIEALLPTPKPIEPKP